MALLAGLGTLGGTDGQRLVGSMLDDPHPPVRRAALLLLLQGGEEGLMRFAAVVARLSPAESVALREETAVEVEQILNLLRASHREEIRLAAIAILNWIGPAAIATLIHVLRDPSPRVRIATIWVIASHGDVGVVENLEALRMDPDPEVRSASLAAIEAVRGPASTRVDLGSRRIPRRFSRPGPRAKGLNLGS